MLKKGLKPRRLFFTPKKNLATCSPALDPPPSSAPTTPKHHNELCFTLTDRLIRRRLLPLAQRVVQRIIKQSPSVSDAISAVKFAAARGLELDSCGYSVLLRKLVDSGEHRFAEAVYRDCVIARGIIPDSETLNSMVICYCNLGKLEEARDHFDRLFEVDSFPCKAACNAMLRELCAREKVSEAFDYFRRIDNVGILLGFWWFNRLIDGLCDKGYLDKAFYMFDTMHERTGMPATIHLYKTLFYGLCRHKRVEEAELLVGEMEFEGRFIDKKMYTSLIYGYCRGKKMRTAMRVFLRMLKMGCDPDTYTYNTLIHGFVKLGLFNKGWILHNQMSELGLQPDVVTYHIMIRRYCDEQKVDCALTLLNNMSSFNLTPSVHTYTVLITALYKENKLVEVEELYKKMLDSGVVPDHVLFFTLMRKQPKGHELHLALKMLQAIAKNGCNLDLRMFSTSATHSPTQDVEQEIECLLGEIVKRNFALADVAFGIFISALCAAGKTDAALLFMDKMVSLGCRPLLSTYNSLIKCLLREGLVEDAKLVVDLMQENGTVPDLATYLIMVHEHCNHGDLDSAFGLLDQMKERGLKPSVAIYDSIIGCLSRRKRIFEAENEFKKMLKAGVDPDDIIYVTMISGYSKNGRAIEARELFDKMIEHGFQPSSNSYTAVISGLVKKNMIDKGCLYLDCMLKNGFVPNTVLYTSLMNQFLRKGELEFALRLVDLMDRNHIECDLITCIALVSGVCRNITPVRRRWYHVKSGSARVREKLLHLLHQSFVIPRGNILSVHCGSSRKIKDFALNLMQKIKGTSFMPNLYLYNGIISGFCRANMIQDAYNHFELMQSEGVCPNQVTFTILINGHTRFGEIDHAVGLFNKMNADGCAPDGITYNALIKGLCKGGRLLDALSVSQTMHKRGLFPNESSYEKLLKCLCASHLGIHAFKIFEEMLSHDYVPCWYNCNWLLCILCEEYRLHEAHIVLDVMLRTRKYPDELTKMLLVEACNKKSFMIEENIWGRLELVYPFLVACQRAILSAAGNQQDVTMKIISFSQGSWAIFTLPANGAISNVNLRQPNSSVPLRYFLCLEIMYAYRKQRTKGGSGGMSIPLTGPDGHALGGLGGLLVADGSIQVLVGRLLPGRQQEQKPKKQRIEHVQAAIPTTMNSIPKS